MTSEEKIRALFVCVHNSAKSQMAEAFLKQLAGDRFEGESAGLEPGALNPLAVEVLKEAGIDISARKATSVFDLYKEGMLYDYVITVCDETSAERRRVFAGLMTRRLHWSFENPAQSYGKP